MQHYSPMNGFPNGNFPFVPAPPVAPPPAIVGEGDVASVTLPDGTLQLYFVPAACANYQPWGHPVAWFIRTIPNLFPASQPPALNQQIDKAPSKHSLSQFWDQEKPGYQLQFHNDKATSSTDMHYFCQSTHPVSWDPKRNETQIEQPKLYEMTCCKLCRCQVCQAPGSKMSIDSTIDENTACHCDAKWNKTRFNLVKKEDKVNKIKWKFGKQSKSEKSVQSVSERASQSVRERASQSASERASQSVRDQDSQVSGAPCGCDKIDCCRSSESVANKTITDTRK